MCAGIHEYRQLFDVTLLSGTGIGEVWYYKVQVLFEPSIDDDTSDARIDRLYVDFDRTVPPRFERSLDWRNEPPPPPLCDSL